jgi:FixJ family two-component response regulator
MCNDATVFLIGEDAAVPGVSSISLSMAGLQVEVYSSWKDFLDVCTGDVPGCLLKI